MVSREGQGGFALGVCMKLFLMRQAVPEYVMESRFSMPSAAIAASTADASLAAVLAAGSAVGAGAVGSALSCEQAVNNSAVETAVSKHLRDSLKLIGTSWLV